MKSILRELAPVGLTVLLILLNPIPLLAGSATWNLTPASGDWNTPANWTPATVPNGQSDTATFESSNVNSVSLSSSVTLDGIVFEEGASTFTITSPSALPPSSSTVSESATTQALNKHLLLIPKDAIKVR